MFRKASVTIVIFCALLATWSCDHELQQALDMSGHNRSELEKVLEHFKDDPDPLKYASARFLIENMGYFYSYDGHDIKLYDSIYLNAQHEPGNYRTEYINKAYRTILFDNCQVKSDLQTIHADFLIKAIDEACDAWSQSSWSKDYDQSVFFNYVLPYRISNECISDWRQTIGNEFPLLLMHKVISRRGLQLEAEDSHIHDCSINDFDGASGRKAVILNNINSSVTFVIDSERSTNKRLILKYTTTNKQLNALISVNGITIDTLYLSPARNIETFVEKWHNFIIPLNAGHNEITISHASDTLGIDYIQIGAIEDYAPADLTDFSSNYYIIRNSQSGHCITFDTVSRQDISIPHLYPFNTTDSCQLLRLDYQGYPLWKICSYKRDSTDICLDVPFGTDGTLRPDSSVFQERYENRPFQQWVFFPLGNDEYRIMNKHTGMFLDTRTDKVTGRELLVQNPYSNKPTQKWELQKRGINPFADSFYTIGSAVSEAMRVYDLTHQFEYFIHDGELPQKISSLFQVKMGKCVDETNFSIFLCKYLGIPSASDFTPHWGNRSNSHSWSVLIKPDGTGTPFYMNSVPGDTAHYFHSYKKPKIFRTQFQLNKEYCSLLRHENSVPRLFQHPKYTDVTDEYYETTDVERDVPAEYKDRKIAYICVFDNRNWVPVFFGYANRGKVTFKAMGRDIVYMAAFYDDNTIRPFANPFYITHDGTVKDIKVNATKKQDMRLLRKYPFMGAQDFFNSRMNGGQFQASNDADFANHIVLHTHKGITNGNWYEIAVKDSTQYKYLRYMGAKGSYCNINELHFYDKAGHEIKGTIIGTEGESWARKENVFDGDILTGFGANSPDGNWVGLQLSRPTAIAKFRYIGRNDGNCIEIGDHYILYFWNDGFWEVLGEKTAASNELIFHNVPSGGLYILRDTTKGVEERIFTYENGKQVWW